MEVHSVLQEAGDFRRIDPALNPIFDHAEMLLEANHVYVLCGAHQHWYVPNVDVGDVETEYRDEGDHVTAYKLSAPVRVDEGVLSSPT